MKPGVRLLQQVQVITVDKLSQNRMKIILLLLIGCCITLKTFAQEKSTHSDSTQKKNLSVVPFPTLSHNKVLGWGGGINVAFNYKLNPQTDSISPPSMTLITPMYYANNSWYAGFFQKFYFNEDLWRVEMMGGYQDILFQFNTESYLPNIDNRYIAYESQGFGLIANVTRKIKPKLYAGIQYRTSMNTLDFEDNPILTEISKLYRTDQLWESGLGAVITYDSRNSVTGPSNGMYGYFKTLSYFDLIGSDVTYNGIELQYAFYTQPNEKMIWATQVYGNYLWGSVPFNDENIMGFSGPMFQDLRGYNQGEFRGDKLYFLQSELRTNLYKGFGLKAFAGMGTAYNTIDEAPFLPSAGLGLRYLASKAYDLYVSVDYAWGKNDNGIYFLIGEAF